MKWFRDLRVFTKLCISSAAVLLVLLVLGVFVTARMRGISEQSVRVTTAALPSIVTLSNMAAKSLELRNAMLLYIHAGSKAETDTRLRTSERLADELEAARAEFLRMQLMDAAERPLWDDYVARINAYLQLRQQVIGKVHDPGRLLGTKIETFWEDTSGQRTALAALRASQTSEIKFGACTMQLVVNPIVDAAGRNDGLVIEWLDRTDELQTEREVNDVVRHALEGDLTHRVRTDGQNEFIETLSVGLNRLMGKMAEMIEGIRAAARLRLVAGRGGELIGLRSVVGVIANRGCHLFHRPHPGLRRQDRSWLKPRQRVRQDARADRSGGDKVSDIVGEIASASREQSTGIEQVNRAVMQMDAVTQQNAALVQEAAAAPVPSLDRLEGLMRQSRGIESTRIARFRTDPSRAVPSAPGCPGDATTWLHESSCELS